MTELIGTWISTFIALAICFAFLQLFNAPDWATFGFLVGFAYLIDIKLRLIED